MRAVRYHDYGDPSVLTIEDVPKPEPGPDEVLVDVRACSVNPVDVYLQEGETHTPAALPAIPGSDFAGVVEAVGDNVTEFSVGDRVHGAGLAFAQQGGYAEYVTAPRGVVARLPDAVGFVEGAAVGHVGVTAWGAVVTSGAPQPLDAVLIHGGSGGVGHVAVQLAKVTGATVVTTAGSQERRQRVSELGADNVFDYARSDLAAAITDAVDNGIDLVVDHRPEDYLALDIDVAAQNCDIVLIDGYSVAVDNLRATRRKDITISGLGAFSAVPSIGGVLARLGRLVANDDLEVEIEQTYALEDAAACQRRVMTESFVGKLVLTP